METKSFLFIAVILVVTHLTACSDLKTRDDVAKAKAHPNHRQLRGAEMSTNENTSHEVSANISTTNDNAPTQPPVQNSNTSILPSASSAQAPLAINQEKKVGLILGPGGARTLGYGVLLEEMQKQKVDVVAISGIEMGSLSAALYSQRALAYDVEWQLSKIHFDELVSKSFSLSGLASISVKPRRIDFFSTNLQDAFHGSKPEQAKVPFFCSALNVKTAKSFVMARGSYENLLKFCMPSPPLFESYSDNFGFIDNLKPLIQQLKSQGANYIVYVDVLNDRQSVLESLNGSDRAVWAMMLDSIQSDASMVNLVVSLDLSGFSMIDYDKQKEIQGRIKDQIANKLQKLVE